MGKGSSGIATGANNNRYYQYGGLNAETTIGTEGKAPSFNTVATVTVINAIRSDEDTISRKALTNEFNKIAEGQSVTFYSPLKSGTRDVTNTADNITTWTKRGDNDWSGSNGGRRTDSEMTREAYNTPRKLGAGEVTTESHTRITGDRTTTTDGISYRAGVYDVLANRGEGVKKYEQQGRIATYNGTRYGVTTDGGGTYNITHVDSGMLVGDARSMKGVSQAIKDADVKLKSSKVVESAVERYKYTIRGD